MSPSRVYSKGIKPSLSLLEGFVARNNYGFSLSRSVAGTLSNANMLMLELYQQKRSSEYGGPAKKSN